MGLVITAYNKLKVIKDLSDNWYDLDDCDEYDNYLLLYDNPDFPDRASPFNSKNVYDGSKCEYLYRSTYSGYSRFRNWLEELFPLDQYPDIDLLLNFSDCEGTIGTEACKKLAQVFAQSKVPLPYHHLEYGKNLFNLHKMIIFACDDGCLHYH